MAKKKPGRGRSQSAISKKNATAAVIAANVRALRNALGLSVQEIVIGSGLSFAQWYRIERADVKRQTPPATLRLLAAALRVDVSRLKKKGEDTKRKEVNHVHGRS